MARSRKHSSKRARRSAARSRRNAPRPKASGELAVGRDLRQHVLDLLRGGSAHATFEAALSDLPASLRGVKPAGAPHTPWQLLEHMRIAQWDILEFSRNSKHVSPKWPDGYWPASEAPRDNAAWEKSVQGFRSDLRQMMDLVGNASIDLFTRIPHGEGQTILREALLVADHNGYHLGQLVLVRRLLGAWPAG